jgi:hypothetical protein
MDKYFRESWSAAAIAAAITAGFIYFKGKMNGQGKLKNSDYIKPAFLVALLVFFIVSQGNGQGEAVSREPY